jgi:hypothetical protein
LFSVTILALVCTDVKLSTRIHFEENGKGKAEENTWTKKDGVRGGRKEAYREVFRDFYSYSSLTVSLFKLNILKRLMQTNILI